jgi:hypothetical protein
MMSKRCLGTATKALVGLAGLLGVASCSLDGAEYVSGRAGGTVLTSSTFIGAKPTGVVGPTVKIRVSFGNCWIVPNIPSPSAKIIV